MKNEKIKLNRLIQIIEFHFYSGMLESVDMRDRDRENHRELCSYSITFTYLFNAQLTTNSFQLVLCCFQMLHFVDGFMRLSFLHLKSFAKSLELLKAPEKAEEKNQK